MTHTTRSKLFAVTIAAALTLTFAVAIAGTVSARPEPCVTSIDGSVVCSASVGECDASARIQSDATTVPPASAGADC